jgi:hypothetical protein
MVTITKRADTVPLGRNAVYHIYCTLVSASNMGQEFGCVREGFEKIGVRYGFLRSRRENNWYPH